MAQALEVKQLEHNKTLQHREHELADQRKQTRRCRATIGRYKRLTRSMAQVHEVTQLEHNKTLRHKEHELADQRKQTRRCQATVRRYERLNRSLDRERQEVADRESKLLHREKLMKQGAIAELCFFVFLVLLMIFGVPRKVRSFRMHHFAWTCD